MARELQETVDETDNRPMRVLGHRTPRRGIRRRTARIAGPTGGVAPLNRHRAHGLRGGEQ